MARKYRVLRRTVPEGVNRMTKVILLEHARRTPTMLQMIVDRNVREETLRHLDHCYQESDDERGVFEEMSRPSRPLSDKR